MRRTLLRILTFTALCAGVLTWSIPAHAAEGYVSQSWKPAGYSCGGGHGGGQTDERGWQYVQCFGITYIYNRTGTLVTTVAGTGKYDVAPSPDGSIIYFMRMFNDKRQVNRATRNADGTYSIDSAWTPDPFPYDGGLYEPRGWFIATDGYGDLYISVGTWEDAVPNTIVKYRPTETGARYLTSWGAYATGAANTAASWRLGYFRSTNTGLAASRDGRYVYVTEMGNSRVQRFERQSDGTYLKFSGAGTPTNVVSWGNTQANDPNRLGSCEDGMFAAPYDVAVDGWGYVYVQNTTCEQIQKFTAAGQHLNTTHYGADAIHANERAHALSVDWAGNVLIGQFDRQLRRTTPTPSSQWPALPASPTADNAAPGISTISIPATTKLRTVTLRIAAHDNRAVAAMRLANDANSLSAATWRNFSNTYTWQLSPGNGSKSVSVQVRDAAGNVSTKRIATTTLDGPNASPVIQSVIAPYSTSKRRVRIRVRAADDVRVVQMRIANENQSILNRPWVSYRASFLHTLTRKKGTKKIMVQVRDSSGAASRIRLFRIRLR